MFVWLAWVREVRHKKDSIIAGKKKRIGVLRRFIRSVYGERDDAKKMKKMSIR
jgi:hypothetical protein